MRVSGIRELYGYNEWANARTMDAAAQLSPEAFVRDMKSSFASVGDTLVHMLQAEWIWLQRWQGQSPPAAPAGWAGMGLGEIRGAWRGVIDERARFLEALEDAALDRVFEYTSLAGETRSCALDHSLRHVVNHASYHRGQITTLLRQLGATPVATDLVLYHDPARWKAVRA
ncbi:MAG: DinB family protein [Gemmatimonadetes bacterium]|nr:DinB family protein [Gemmatimonadota bacterium]